MATPTMRTALLLAVGLLLATAAAAEKKECGSDGGANSLSFGVDVSYPIHSHQTISNNPLGDKQGFYDRLLTGCRESCSECDEKCTQNENERIAMNRRQPRSMVNYTDIGIKKIRAPEEVMKLLTEFWENNKGLEYPEKFSTGNVLVNHWEMPSYMLGVENSELQGGGNNLKKMIWDAAVKTVSEWTGQELTTSSLFGIRVYKEGAVLAPHVDRLPLVSSAIINVAQDVDEPWPLEVYTHDGRAVNVTMEPGDLVLYESHSIVHGRPYPLKGRFFANVFIHFQPLVADYDAMPSYIIPGSPEAKKWEIDNKRQMGSTGPTEAHSRAAAGDVKNLELIAVSKKRSILFQPDENGWCPLHEAARAGEVDVIKFLLKEGANADVRVNGGKSALAIAMEVFSEDSEVVQVLREAGSRLGPETFDE